MDTDDPGDFLTPATSPTGEPADRELAALAGPTATGLTFRQTTELLRLLLGGGTVIGMDVACFHTNLDRSGTATKGLVDLLVHVLEG